MIDLQIENIYSKILTPLTSQFRDTLYFALSYPIQGAEHSDLYRSGLWDGRKSFFRKKSQTFPTGLYSRVVEQFEKIGEQINSIDLRVVPKLGKPLPIKFTLRDYQEEIVTTALECQRGIVSSCTSSGKTTCIAALIGRLHLPTIVFVHKKVIAIQLQKDISEQLNYPVGLIGGGYSTLHNFTVGTIQTACSVFNIPVEKELEGDDTIVDRVKYREFLEKCQCVICDEGHHISTNTYVEVLSKMKEAYYRYSFSGTPFRADGADMAIETMAGRKIIEISASRLIKEGYLSKPTIYMVKFKHKRQPQKLSYGQLYRQEITENSERNKIIVDYTIKYYNEGKSVLISVLHIRHGQILLDILKSYLGDKVVFVNGTNSGDQLYTALGDLDNKKLSCVICTTVFSEGINVVSLDVLIAVKAMESHVDALQLLGRILRKTDIKNKSICIDIADENVRYFSQHTKNRLLAYQREEEFEIKFVDGGMNG